MTYCADRNQAQRLEQDEVVEAVYLGDIANWFDNPTRNAEIIYLQRFCEGMKQYTLVTLN
jgi:hypothetical protein